ncbi:hypothetical protein B566_EDAN006633 [Ephemera danica]|nr:hypothetical protein B566_EDAN006633 [Ephemera danica]
MEEGAEKKHKAALEKLKKSDPSFYKYLEENDKELLNFDASDSDDDSDTEKVHQPPDELEVDSEESDFEGDEADSDDGVEDIGGETVTVTLKMVEKWTQQLQDENSVGVIAEVVRAFQACIQRVAGSEEDKQDCKYRVSGSAVFNAILQMCILELQPALRRILNLPTSGSHGQPSKSKKWSKIKPSLMNYITNLVKLLSRVSSEHIQAVVLKHLHQMTPLVACFGNLSRVALRRLATMWSEGATQEVRILAFLCIAKLACDRQNQQLEFVLKLMYVTYVRNSKFVSPNTLPGLNFMRRSLVEIFAIDEAAAYQHVFLYVRQLAIHLRNAITTQKKEAVQTVYNWQYINSLHLWCELLGNSSEVSPLRSLIYPLVQVVLGTVKVKPTAQYYPLRFHCARMLTLLSRRSRVFVPVLPLLLDVVVTFNVNKPSQKVSMKPLDLNCVLRASKVQQLENGYKDSVIEQIYCCLLEYLSVESSSIAFPDLVLPLVVQLRQFCKTCKVGNYNKKMKSLLDKIDENIKFVERERSSLTIKLSNTRAVHDWEQQLRSKGTPLQTFHDSWTKAITQKNAQKVTQSHKIGNDFEVPVIKKGAKRAGSKTDGPTELFPSDDDDSDADNIDLLKDEELEEPRPKKTRKGKRAEKRKASKQVDVLAFPDSGDIVEEFKLSDYE